MSKAAWRWGSLIALIIVVLIDIFTKDYTQEISANLSQEIQKDSSEYYNKFFLIIANAAMAGVFMIPIIIYMIDYTILGIMSIFLYSFATWLTSILGMAYAEHRPLQQFSTLTAIHACVDSYGSPCIHALGTAAIWSLIFMRHRKIWVLVGILIWIFVVGFERLYSGEAYFMSLLVSWMMAFALLCWMPIIYRVAEKLRFIWLHVVAGIMLVASAILYTYRDPQEFSNFNADCYIHPEDALGASLKGSAQLTLFLGAWIGYKYYGKRCPSESPVLKWAATLWALIVYVLFFFANMGINSIPWTYWSYATSIVIHYMIGLLATFAGTALFIKMFGLAESTEKLLY